MAIKRGNIGLPVNIASFAQSAIGGDWSKAFQAAHDFCELQPNGGTVTFPPGFNKQFMTAITWNPNRVAVNGAGAVIDCSAFSGSSYFVNFRQSIMDANARSSYNRAHPWENTVLTGTGSAVGSIACVRLTDLNPITVNSYWLPGVTFNNVSFVNWWRDIEIGDGGFFLNCDNCVFAITSGSGYISSILLLNASNAGENINFNRSFFGKVYGTNIVCLNPNASVIANGCSADYTSCLFDFQGGSLDWNGYIESSKDLDFWVKVSGQNTLVTLNGQILITGDKSTYEPFYVDGSATNGGLVMNASIQWGASAYTVASGLLIRGPETGRAIVKFYGHSNTSVHPGLGGGTNAIANGSFETSSITSWTLTGTTLPLRVNGPARTGAWSLRLPGAPTNTPSAVLNQTCKPGQQLVGVIWYQTAGLTATGGTFAIVVEYLDAGNTVLQGLTAASVTTTVPTWTKANLGQFLPAPIGTEKVRISVTLFGTTSGAPNGYIDDVTIAVV